MYLVENYAFIVIVYYIKGYSFVEIEKMRGIKTHTVSSNSSRALEKLREIINTRGVCSMNCVKVELICLQK